MELEEVKKLIDEALGDCQEKLDKQPDIVLSEADFERLVSWSIMKKLGHADYKKPQPSDFTVHTQVSHYIDGIDRPDKRMDILLMIKEKIEAAKHRKGYEYINDSFALELKYIHKNESLGNVRCDFCKRFNLELNSWLYVVVLIDSDNDELFQRKKNEIEDMKNELLKEHSIYNGKLFCAVLRKDPFFRDTM